MRCNDLFETISVAAVDRQARAALDKALQDYLSEEWDHFSSIYPDADSHAVYDEWYQAQKSTVGTFTRGICWRASAVLSEIVHEDLVRQFGDLQIHVNRDGFDYAFYAGDVDVRVEAREESEDSHKHFGGYFSQTDRGAPLIRCFVNQRDIQHASWGAMQMVAFGEGEDFDLLTNIIAPVFAHEYAHAIQFLRGASRNSQDIGYITAHGGKRGGRRNPRNDNDQFPDARIAWLRYKGSAKEIDSFASEAASEIIAELSSRSYGGEVDHDKIRIALTDIAIGYDADRITSSYRQLNYRAVEGEFRELGVPDREINTVWKRYLKLLYKKLWGYSMGTMGRTKKSNWNKGRYPEAWEKAASRGMSYCAAYIANQVAAEVDPNRRYDLQSNGSNFIELYFFGEEFGYDFENSMKITRAFNRLVDKALDRQNHFGA